MISAPNSPSDVPSKAVFHPMPRRLKGKVVEFDEGRGLGAIKTESDPLNPAAAIGDEAEHYLFHSTRIADGTRSIKVGTLVEFSIIAGAEGRWEANAISEAEKS